MPGESPADKKKTFTYEQAVALLPEVRRLTEAAYRQVAALGADTPDAVPPARGVQAQLDTAVDEWVRSIRALGAEVKGLWLVDFDNGSGYYCWRYPEQALQYYHSYEEGFRGRLRIQ